VGISPRKTRFLSPVFGSSGGGGVTLLSSKLYLDQQHSELLALV